MANWPESWLGDKKTPNAFRSEHHCFNHKLYSRKLLLPTSIASFYFMTIFYPKTVHKSRGDSFLSRAFNASKKAFYKAITVNYNGNKRKNQLYCY